MKSQSDSAGPDDKTGQREITGKSESGKSQSEAESSAGQPEEVQLKSEEMQVAGVEEGDKAKDAEKVDAEVSSKVKTELLDTSGEQASFLDACFVCHALLVCACSTVAVLVCAASTVAVLVCAASTGAVLVCAASTGAVLV